MTYNPYNLKLMVLQGPLTNEQLRSSHPLSVLVNGNGSQFRILPAGETDSLLGRQRIGRVSFSFHPSNNKSNHHLEMKILSSMREPVPNSRLVLVSHYETPLKKVINVEFYSCSPEETIEYFI
jgi:hypothetical protein